MASITPGCAAAICESTSAGPSGCRRPASRACTSFVQTLRWLAKTACDARSAARIRLTARASKRAGGRGSVVVRVVFDEGKEPERAVVYPLDEQRVLAPGHGRLNEAGALAQRRHVAAVRFERPPVVVPRCGD